MESQQQQSLAGQQTPSAEQPVLQQLSNAQPLASPASNAPSENRKSAGGGKSKKRKRNQDLGPGAPRQPVNGYVRFLNERREQVRANNPSAGFAEIMKIMAQEWTQLPTEEKQKYMQAAEADRQRYQKELQDYQQTDAYRAYCQQQQQRHVQQQLQLQQQQRQALGHHTQAPPQATVVITNPGSSQIHFPGQMQGHNSQMDMIHGQTQNRGDESNERGNESGVFDIPIFTEEFLDHNKARDLELRQLRKAVTEYEEQNATLQKHVETMQAAVGRLEAETEQQRCHNMALQQHLDSLRHLLVSSFSGVQLPGFYEPLSMQNVDNFLVRLHSYVLEHPQADLIPNVRNVVSKLEWQQ